MAVRKFKPTTPGQRHKIIGTFEDVNLSPQHRGKDIKLLVLSKKLLHGYQKSLLYLERNPQVAVTM